MSKKNRKRNRQTKKKPPANDYDELIALGKTMGVQGQTNQANVIHKGNRWWIHYYNWLTKIAMQMYEWENVPDEIPNYEIEKNLTFKGMCAFYYSKKRQSFVAVYGGAHDLNLYNEPTKFTVSNPQMSGANFNLYVRAKNIPNCGVLIRNNLESSPMIVGLENYATALASIKVAIDNQLIVHQHPVTILATDNNKLSVQKMLDSMDVNNPYMVVYKNADGTSLLDDISSLDLKAPYIVDKLYNSFNNVWNEAMMSLGLDSLSVDKKERLTAGENEANNQQTMATLNYGLMFREDACNRINEYFYDELGFLDKKISVHERQILVTSETGVQYTNATSKGGSSNAVQLPNAVV